MLPFVISIQCFGEQNEKKILCLENLYCIHNMLFFWAKLCLRLLVCFVFLNRQTVIVGWRARNKTSTRLDDSKMLGASHCQSNAISSPSWTNTIPEKNKKKKMPKQMKHWRLFSVLPEMLNYVRDFVYVCGTYAFVEYCASLLSFLSLGLTWCQFV